VRLGGGYADLLAAEPSGRLAIIEVKLAKSPEARRAVIAQVLTYAAYLRGMTRETLEQDVLAAYLRGHEHESLDHLRGPGRLVRDLRVWEPPEARLCAG
jgi:hypothetical protein